MAKQQCSVFISSTSEDLQEYRLAAREAALRAGFLPVMMEYFAASGGPPLRECLAKVEPCDVVVVIAAQRYGWVPSDQPLSGAKSITWLECERAKDLLVFFPDQDVTWPVERTEAYRLTAAFNESKFTPELVAEVTRNTAKLAEFRAWLNGRTRASFKTPADLQTEVVQALYEWLKRHPECQPLQKGPSNPRPYLEWLREQTATIDIRGLGVGSGKAHKFPIEDLYIPLTTQREAEAPTERERKPMELEEALVHRRLVIVGDPCSGKTTFLRRIANALANGTVGKGAGIPQIGQDRSFWDRLLSLFRRTEAAASQPFPLFIRIAVLIEHIERCRDQPGRHSPEPESEQWLSSDPLTNVVVLAWPFQFTIDPATKPDPFTVKVKPGPPGSAVGGINGCCTNGTGF